MFRWFRWFRWFREFSDEMVRRFGNLLTVTTAIITVTTGFAACIGLGMEFQKIIDAPYVQKSATMPIGAAGSNSKVCDALSQVTHLQAAYDARIQPIQQRWIELTASLERSDLLPYERDKVLETADLVQQEMERAQAEHGKIVDGITQLCKQN